MDELLFSKKYYIRKSKRSIEANQDEISSLLRKPLEFMATWEKLSVIDATENDMDIIEINETINFREY